MSSLQQNKNFKGSLNDFIRKIKECNNHYDIQDDKITERLVRYYITQSIIPRPNRDGKEFFYMYEHLLKFLYARKQIIDGWPLSKLKEMMKFEENQYFEDFFKSNFKTDKNIDSMSLIRSFKSESFSLSDKKIQSSNPIKYQERKDIPNLKEALFAIDADLGNVVKQEFTTLQLSSWLVLLIENHKLSGMTYEQSKKIGDAISAALIERKPMTSQELQKEFSQYKENEQLKYNLEKLSRENEYLRHRMEEEKQDKYESEKIKTDAIQKLRGHLEDFQNKSMQWSEKKYVASDEFYNNLKDFKSKLDSVNPENFEQEINNLIMNFERNNQTIEIERNEKFHQNQVELKILYEELDRITSIFKK
jgi:hypothetical protein